MIKKLQTLLVTFISSLTLLLPAVAMPALVHAADIEAGLNCGTNLEVPTDGVENCPPPSGDESSDINDIITLVINVFSVVVGIIAVIMIIVGGIRFVLSGGDSAATTSARNTVLYAIVGLVIVAVAQIIVRYVLGRVNTATG